MFGQQLTCSLSSSRGRVGSMIVLYRGRVAAIALILVLPES